jgi:hypothetical protein
MAMTPLLRLRIIYQIKPTWIGQSSAADVELAKLPEPPTGVPARHSERRLPSRVFCDAATILAEQRREINLFECRHEPA